MSALFEQVAQSKTFQHIETEIRTQQSVSLNTASTTHAHKPNMHQVLGATASFQILNFSSRFIARFLSRVRLCLIIVRVLAVRFPRFSVFDKLFSNSKSSIASNSPDFCSCTACIRKLLCMKNPAADSAMLHCVSFAQELGLNFQGSC